MVHDLLLLLLPFVALSLVPEDNAALQHAVSLNDEVLKLAAQKAYWPGFDPAGIPLAIYDGSNTYLFRHPALPEGFVDHSGVAIFAGRHPAVVANSSAPIGDISTATLMADSFPSDMTLRDRAAVAIHEAFHVFQATTGRKWGANEADLFMYPLDDAALLALSRLEVDALRRAISASDRAEAMAWGRAALKLRHERYSRLDPKFSDYERGTEAIEGTAAHVQHCVSGTNSRSFLDNGFPADDVRNRAYWTGVAMALLLDQFQPDWKTGFAKDGSRHLDSDLAGVLAGLPDAVAAEFTVAERTQAETQASTDVTAMQERRQAEQTRFLSRPGWKLVVESDDRHAIWPQGFDPLNVHRLEKGILHTRFLKAGNDDGTIEILGCEALTEGTGPHPLFNGITRIVLTGLSEKPQISYAGDRVTVTTSACQAEFAGVTVSESDSTVVIRLAGEK